MAKAATEQVWRALGDPTRRRLLDLLRGGPRTTGELCAPFRLSRFAVMKHLGVLETAKLIVVERRGRERFNHMNAAPLREVYERWVSSWADRWAQGLTNVKRLAEETKERGAMADSELRTVQVEQEIAIAAPIARVWKALVEETPKWWPREFCTSERTRAFIIEPRIGGRAYEDWGNGEGHQWYQVIGVESPNYLSLLGQLSPQYGGPAVAMLTLRLEAKGKETVLKLSDHTFGRVSDTLQGQTAEGWQVLFGGFKKYVETKPSKKRN